MMVSKTTKENSMKLNAKILFLRKREGMSQEDLAEKIDVSRQTVYKWESGAATPEITKIKQLAKLFNVSFDYLMDDEIEKIESTEKLPARKNKHRYVHHSNIPMRILEADLDHGYTDHRKRKIRNSDEIFQERKEKMYTLLSTIGANKTILLQGDMAGCFFENPHEMFFWILLRRQRSVSLPLRKLYQRADR
ncbi:MAG: helix-turn-helix transcriptional regulator [Ruminococcaceae bacterium]|nr:helix-turn-helix transcriptional regulator [Oscillospiraceae bacterium]